MDSNESERKKSFSITVEAASSPFRASWHETGLKTDTHIKIVTKPKNRNQDQLRPISGQASAQKN